MKHNNPVIKTIFQLCFTVLFLFIPLVFACCSSEKKPVENRYGENKSGSKKILVVYATKLGSTAEVADYIGRTLSDKGAITDVKHVKTVTDISGYQAVVLGSAVRKGRLLKESVDFVKKFRSELAKIPVAYFVVCMTMKDNTEAKRRIADSYLDPLRSEITPVDSGLFAGKMDYSELGFLNYIIIKYIVKIPEGDFRDWNLIKAWSDNLYTRL